MHNSADIFFQHSKTIAEKFLQTVVIIDDQAEFGERKALEPETDEQVIEKPKDQYASNPDEPALDYSLTPPTVASNPDEHSLDAQAIINSFAEKGIVCSVIKPTKDLTLANTTQKLASSADIIVLDWSLDGAEDKGTKALKILEHISKAATETPRQVRLFIIYTGEPDITDIAERIKTAIESELHVNVNNGEDFTLKFGSIRISIFVKPYTYIPPEYQSRTVAFSELAERVTTEFARMTAGLVSNVALEAMSCIRKNTSRLLERFKPELDPAYLTHRFLQPTPEDAEELLITLLAAEIEAILEDEKVGRAASSDPISSWLDANEISEIEPFSGKKLDQAQLSQLVEKGLSGLPDKFFNRTQKDTLHINLTASLSKVTGTADLDAKFAILTNLRSFYENSVRQLTLGTIVKRISSETEVLPEAEYYLCIQPVCDAVRLDGARAFLFIPLVVRNDKFSIVIREVSLGKETFIRLHPKFKTFHLKLIEFGPRNGEDRIVSIQSEGTYHFKDVGGRAYEWLGELRSENGLRNLRDLSDEMSRVGLNESEWLRRSAGRH